MTKLLLQIYWKQFKRTFSGLRAGQILPIVAVGFLGLMFLPIFILGVRALGEILPVEFLASLFSIIALSAVILTMLFAIPQVFKHLFSSRDVEFLFTLPVATKHIFWVKYIQSFFSTAGFVWILLVLFFVVFGSGANVSGFYYVAVPLVSLAVVLIGLTIAYLFNLVLIQIIPRSRANELMTLMTGMAGLFVIILFQLPNIMGWNRVSVGLTSELPTLPVLLPTTWAGESLSLFSQGFSFTAFVWAISAVVFAVIVSLLTSTIVEKGFRTGWIRLSEGTSRKKKRKRPMKKSGLLKHPIIFLGMKELRAVQRDPREWLTFLPLLVIMIFPIVALMTNEGTRQAIIHNPLISWLVAHAMIIFFFTMLMGNFSASSIGREEKAVWILRTLPLTGMQIALGKLWIHWLIPFSFVIILEIVLTFFLGWAWYLGVAGVLSIGFISLGMSSIGLWAGTIGGKYNPNNPQQRIETGTGFLLIFINIPYMLLMFAIAVLLFMPTEFQLQISNFSESSLGFLSFLASIVTGVLSVKNLLGDWSMLVGILTLVIASLTITYLFLWLSAKRIDQGIQITIVDGSGGKLKKL
ncbi:ABC-2 type transport system permease protein [Evansella vedderi]|uniref:ABC-2 type transport system permease protein n=1 Tax=Evansella vedderi TaxID=38282 RepID=A0ABT9ZQF8_9BACI|nr:hypothetical protein [Evansella vedderi]MDQ0253477.1 ABC-2 type transport system permease protein [Evansella vedderi]